MLGQWFKALDYQQLTSCWPGFESYFESIHGFKDSSKFESVYELILSLNLSRTLAKGLDLLTERTETSRIFEPICFLYYGIKKRAGGGPPWHPCGCL